MRADNRGDSQGLPHHSAHAGAAHCARKGKDSRDTDSVRGADAAGIAGATGSVLQVIYLVFNEGYSAAAGAEVTRAELTGEAIRLGRLLSDLRPEPEVMGLLSLMLLQESPRAARTSPTGELILLDNQDRSLWNRGGESPEVPPLRRLHSSGGHCGCSRREFLRGIHGLAPDYAALRPVASDSAIAGCRTETRSSRCDVRRSGTGASSYR